MYVYSHPIVLYNSRAGGISFPSKIHIAMCFYRELLQRATLFFTFKTNYRTIRDKHTRRVSGTEEEIGLCKIDHTMCPVCKQVTKY